MSGGAPGEGVFFHRPARDWPSLPAGGPILLPAPPANPISSGGGGRRWALLLPMLGSLGMVGFAFVARSFVYVLLIGGMVVAMVGATLGTQLAASRQQARSWARARRRYLDVVEAARGEAEGAARQQYDGLSGLYPSPEGVLSLVGSGEGVWERRRDDADFASVRLGLGPVGALRPVRLSESADGSVMVEPDPELAEAAEAVCRETDVLVGAPVVVDLARLGVVAVVGGAGHTRALVASWLASLAAFHSPADLRLVGLIPAEEEAVEAWDWLKWLPHCRDPQASEGFARARRSFSTDPAVFVQTVDALVRERVETTRAVDPLGGAVNAGWDHVVVVVEGWTPGGELGQLQRLMAAAERVAVTVVVLVDGTELVPEQAGATVVFESPTRVRHLEAGPGGRVETGVLPDRLVPEVGEGIARRLSPLRFAGVGAGVAASDSVRLADLFGAEEATAAVAAQAPISRAQVAKGARSGLLAAPIGRDDSGAPLILDLAEAAAGGMGPHGILVGATGSGKSELLRSLAAGLAVRHDPDVLQLLLVDYKGGAAFAGLGDLPHVAGLVTNLADEPDLIGRVQAALGGELERRQRLLRDAGNLNSIGELHRQGGPGAADMAYLVVVVDEFGELLVAEPGFADTFNAIGRLGRSLGIHLLLATQRLDEGRIRTLEPHLRYRIALRTYTSGESRAVLGTPAAYELAPIPGLGYLKVDERTVRFKSAIATLPERPSVEPDAGELLRPLSVNRPVATPGAAPIEGGRNQLERLVQAVATRHQTRARRVWTDPLPAAITLGALSQPATGSGVAVGVVDLPAQQRSEPLLWDPWARHGNLGIAGGPRTGKSMLVATVVLATINTDPSCQVYGLDLAGGGLRALEGLPQVGAMIGPGEPETAARLVADLRTLVAERAGLSPDARARAPMVLFVVDGTGLLRQTLPELETAIAALATTGLAQRVHVLVAANRWFDLRPQLLDALNLKWELALGDPSETVFERAAAKALPAGRPGRGLTKAGAYFQAALPSWGAEPDPLGPEADLAHAIDHAAGDPRAIPAPRVASLPVVVHEADLAALAVAAGSSPPDPEAGFVIGVSEHRSHPVQLDPLAAGAHLLLYGDTASGKTTLLRRLLCYLERRETTVLHLVDPSRSLIDLAEGATSYAATANLAEKLAATLASELSERLPPETATIAELQGGPHWQGPQHVLVIDDYDLIAGQLGSPLAPLAELVAYAADVGLHVICARRIAGSGRAAFETFTQRLRDLRPPTLIFSGTADEGPITAGVTPRPLPRGRAIYLTSTGGTQLVQCCQADPPTCP